MSGFQLIIDLDPIGTSCARYVHWMLRTLQDTTSERKCPRMFLLSSLPRVDVHLHKNLGSIVGGVAVHSYTGSGSMG